MITHYLNYNNEKKNKIEKNNKCILKKMNDCIEKDLMNSNNSCGGEDNNNDNHIKNDTSIDKNINNINSNQSEDNDDNSNNNNNNNNNNNDSNHNKYYIKEKRELDDEVDESDILNLYDSDGKNIIVKGKKWQEDQVIIQRGEFVYQKR